MAVHPLLQHHAGTADLVARFADGDERALAVLMARFNGLMRRAALRYVRSEVDAADAVQDTWTLFASHALTIRDPDRLAGWLRITTARVALGIAVRQARVEPVADIDRVRDVRRLPHHGAEADTFGQRRDALRVAVGRLQPRERQLVLLLVAEPRHSYEQIAGIMGCSVGSIGPTRQRICSKLARDPAIVQVRLDGAA